MKTHFINRTLRCRTLLTMAVLGGLAADSCPAQTWSNYGRNPQHTAIAPAPAQRLQKILWSTPVDLQPQYTGDSLYIHYGSPLITVNNTVIVTVKTGAGGGFRMEGRKAVTGALIWRQATDYVLPAHDWVPSCGSSLTPDNKLVIPGAGGTLLRRNDPDHAGITISRLAFFGIKNYRANPAAFNNSIKICTPVTSDNRGNLYFGFTAATGAPLGLKSGIARVAPNGAGTWIAAAAAAGDADIKKVAFNCAPALNRSGDTLYIAVNNLSGSGFGTGYLLALDSQTLAQRSKVRLRDAENPANNAILPDDGTASPTVGPDGDVYYGVLENPPGANNFRGWLLHFNHDLSQVKTPGAFGWDDTASIVPAAAVPSYSGVSPYLVLTKYNNYAGSGGNGVNRLAILDPNVVVSDPATGAKVMARVITIAGPTPDQDLVDAGYPRAVREWCINTAAVDVKTRCALVNNEDGILYRWDFTTNKLSEKVVLTQGIGEAYTPTIVGPDGIVYAINNARLFAVGEAPAPALTK